VMGIHPVAPKRVNAIGIPELTGAFIKPDFNWYGTPNITWLLSVNLRDMLTCPKGFTKHLKQMGKNNNIEINVDFTYMLEVSQIHDLLKLRPRLAAPLFVICYRGFSPGGQSDMPNLVQRSGFGGPIYLYHRCCPNHK
jgi:hypothetical protein